MKKLFQSTVVLSLLILLFVRCAEEKIDIDNSPNLRKLSTNEQELIQTSNTFALDLFKAINKSKGNENIFISPLSVDLALNMAVNGAAGETQQEMKETMGIQDISNEAANIASRDLIDFLHNIDKKVSLSIANAIWYKHELTLENGFSQLIEEYYKGKIEGLDFNDPTAKDIINKWVEDQTQGKIKDLIEKVSPAAAMFLVNAIYFKADWMYQFEKSQTKEDKFTLEDGSQVPVQMMFSKGVELKHYTNEALQLLDIPYGNGQFSMVVLLPHQGKTTEEVLSSLSPQELQDWIDRANTFTPQLFMPKFTLKFKMELIEPLMDMGMERPFSNAAEFPHFFEETKSLMISTVTHQAFIEVNEEGAEAAAATAIGVELTSVGLNEPPVIRIDRPFVFFIREKHSGAILFAGKMMDPS